ncbi:MAG: hypothetical protein ACLTXT_06790 [Ruminococcus callidus]
MRSCGRNEAKAALFQQLAEDGEEINVILKGAIFMKQIFVLTYNYANKKLAQMAIACVIRCRSTHGRCVSGTSLK